jgi:hypothetical protein
VGPQGTRQESAPASSERPLAAPPVYYPRPHRARILPAMTRAHVIVIGIAALLAGLALFSAHTTEGLGIAAAILTGVFGHAQGSTDPIMGARRRPAAEVPGPAPEPLPPPVVLKTKP